MAIPALLVAAGVAGYLWLALRRQPAGRRWSRWRAAVFVAGALLLELGLFPRGLPYPEGDFRNHMLQHLLIGMLAPIGLVMGAPVTLILRSVRVRRARALLRVLRSPVLRIIANPVFALLVDLGGMAALYFTPLYTEMMVHPALHHAVHAHFVAAGCLYTWVIAGPDPAPHRPSVPARLVVLGVAVLIHSVLAQLLYAGRFVVVAAPALALRQGAVLMYYGGDIAEMLLAVALVTTWRPRR